MHCYNSQIGEIDYEDEHIFTVPEGLIGFEQLHKFVVISDQETEPFRWLVSIEDKDVCLPVLDPKLVITNYDVLNRFPEEATVAVIASLKDPIAESTINMRSPLLFDAKNRTARQIILPDERFAIQHRFVGEPQTVAA
jgi:flagellar assembly factor FliW